MLRRGTMTAEFEHTPSSGATRYLLPQGEKGPDCDLAGEGARRADEGAGTNRLKPLARTMRDRPTQAERAMWLLLRDRRLVGFKFRRQVPLDYFIADFLCYRARLIVELDGSQHAQSAADARRDEYLRSQGFRVLRFWNSDVLARPTLVLETVWQALHTPSSAPSGHLLPQRGEGVPTENAVLSPSPLEGEGAFSRPAKKRVRGPALSHASMPADGAGPLIRPSGTFSLKGRRERAPGAAKDRSET
jgi:very-short-patch-repair endonuclease